MQRVPYSGREVCVGTQEPKTLSASHLEQQRHPKAEKGQCLDIFATQAKHCVQKR